MYSSPEVGAIRGVNEGAFGKPTALSGIFKSPSATLPGMATTGAFGKPGSSTTGAVNALSTGASGAAMLFCVYVGASVGVGTTVNSPIGSGRVITGSGIAAKCKGVVVGTAPGELNFTGSGMYAVALAISNVDGLRVRTPFTVSASLDDNEVSRVLMSSRSAMFTSYGSVLPGSC